MPGIVIKMGNIGREITGSYKRKSISGFAVMREACWMPFKGNILIIHK